MRILMRRAWKMTAAFMLSLTFITTNTQFVGAADVDFTDIQGHWAMKDIELLQDSNLINGDVNGKFRPNDSITRAEFTILVFRVYGFKPSSEHERVTFTDVPEAKWYAKGIEDAATLGIVTGDQGVFHPEQSITREEMATILYRGLKMNATSGATATEDKFKEVSDAANIAPWATEAVTELFNRGLLEGRKNNEFDPKALSTRAEAASLIARLFK